MAVKKSELYSLLWEACNKLRGGVEPARYKDYVLVLLFFKYVSDRYKGQRRADFVVNPGASFDDLIKAKGKPDVGERVNKILQKFLEDNELVGALPDVSFINADELGTGKELVDKVSGLIAVFEDPSIDFRTNRASGDDIIGDAYEYFMMKFAQESGKSKGQFYTPSEVSRTIARLIGIGDITDGDGKDWTLYDPACGSGSLLIRAADEAPVDEHGDSIVTIFGQEKDISTAGLARMNLILHQKGTGTIEKGNTLSDPKFVTTYKTGLRELKQFDFIVMNPPFSGTLLIDVDSEWAYSDGNKRNTLVHEILHWYKDKKYFELMQRRSGEETKIYPIMCRQSQFSFTPQKRTQKNQIEWLEWQAHRITPRILMPKLMFRKKAIEYLNQGINSCDDLVQELSDFFIVSRISVKIRLIEVGLKTEIESLTDYRDVYTELNRRKEYVQLTNEDALSLVLDNSILQEWIDSHGLIFVDGYFILPDSKYIVLKHGFFHLSKYAKKHLNECAINICEQIVHKYKHQGEELKSYAVLYKFGGGDERILTFLPGVQAEIKKTIQKHYAAATDDDIQTAYSYALGNLLPVNEEVEKELLRLIGDEDKTLCDCLWYLIGQKGWKTGLDFYDGTLVHENYYGRIKNNKANNMKTDTLMAICVGLGLQLRIIEKIYSKSNCKLHYYDEPDRTRIRILQTFPTIGIADFNNLLTTQGLRWAFRPKAAAYGLRGRSAAF